MGRGNRGKQVALDKSWIEIESAIDWATPTLLLPVGLPGSGKSTWATWQASRKNCQVVSADSIRLEIFDDLQTANNGGRKNHERVFQEMHRRIEERLRNGETVIADATNLYSRARSPIYRLAKVSEAKIEIILWSNANAALERNRGRDRQARVPEKPMLRMQELLSGITDELSREGRLHIIPS